MFKRYFRKKEPQCDAASIKWIEMSGKEYYRFVTDPENKSRWFVDMGDVVLECTEEEYKRYKAEDDHSSYILKQEADWITLSLNSTEEADNIALESTLGIEETAIRNLQKEALRRAVRMLTEEEYRIITLKYGADQPMSEEKIGTLVGLSQSGVSRQIKRIKIFLKKFVIEFEKSSQ